MQSCGKQSVLISLIIVATSLACTYWRIISFSGVSIDDKELYIANAYGTYVSGHSEEIISIAVSEDSTFLVTGSRDYTVRIWALSSSTQIGMLEGHTSPIRSLSISKSGSLIASGCSDSTIKLWDSHSQSLIGTLLGHSNWITSLKFTPDESFLVSASLDGTIIIWDLSTLKLLNTLTYDASRVICLDISPDMRYIVSGHSSNNAIVWEFTNGNMLHVLTGHVGPVSAIAVSRDSRIVVTAAKDAEIRVWDIAQGIEITRQRLVLESVLHLGVTEEGIVAVSRDSKVVVYDIESHEVIDRAFIRSTGRGLKYFSLTYDGNTIFYGDYNKVEALDLLTGLETYRIGGDYIVDAKISSDLKYGLVVYEDASLGVWYFETKKEVVRLREQKELEIWSNTYPEINDLFLVFNNS